MNTQWIVYDSCVGKMQIKPDGRLRGDCVILYRKKKINSRPGFVYTAVMAKKMRSAPINVFETRAISPHAYMPVQNCWSINYIFFFNYGRIETHG